jgi:hypothetical protein
MKRVSTYGTMNPHLLEPQEVGVNSTPPDSVSTRLRELSTSTARQERRSESDGATDATCNIRREGGRRDVAGLDLDLVWAESLDNGPDFLQE